MTGAVLGGLVPLVSSIVGGLLVLAGHYVARRAEDRRVWRLRLHEAAADLASSYLQEAAMVNDGRRSGKDKEHMETSTYVVDRQRALGRFRTLPDSPRFETERRGMGAAIQEVWAAWDDVDAVFQQRYDTAREAVETFSRAIGQHLGR